MLSSIWLEIVVVLQNFKAVTFLVVDFTLICFVNGELLIFYRFHALNEEYYL